MTDTCRVNLELAVVLPLGVVANQLARIEADLRFVNMKALAYARQRENDGPAPQIAAQLEKIHEALDLIRGLMSDIEADVQSTRARPRHPRSTDQGTAKPRADRDD